MHVHQVSVFKDLSVEVHPSGKLLLCLSLDSQVALCILK